MTTSIERNQDSKSNGTSKEKRIKGFMRDLGRSQNSVTSIVAWYLSILIALSIWSNGIKSAQCLDDEAQSGEWPTNSFTDSHQDLALAQNLLDQQEEETSYNSVWPSSSAEEPSLTQLRTFASALAGARYEDNNRRHRILAEPTLGGSEIFLLEDKDYPRSLFEDYSKRVGQISGITTLPSNDVVIFHRAERQWNETSKFPILKASDSKQDLSRKLEQILEHLIKNDTLMIIDGENGNEVTTFGSNMFYMPHSVASDPQGNLWVSDVGRHQIMRLPVGQVIKNARGKRVDNSSLPLWPDIILGEQFTPGQDEAHFCQPAEIAVSSSGRLVYIADGYCNHRVVVVTGQGMFVKSFGQEQHMNVVHSLALFEERNLLCVADRENGRILCYHAGLDGDLARLGQLEHQLNYPIGRVFALATMSRDHLLVSSNQIGTNRYDLAILNPFTQELKLVWTSSDLLEPHSLARTFDRQYAYAADVSRDAFKKVFKFNIISRN